MIVPSVDVRGGRLGNGSEQPVAARARDLVADGAEELHLVDLDGAETGLFLNLEVLAEVARAVDVPCRLAGGVSRVDEARRAIDRGFAGVLFSSAVFGDDELLRDVASLGDRAIVEVEARAGFLAPRGGDPGLVTVATGRGALASARAAQLAGVRGLEPRRGSWARHSPSSIRCAPWSVSAWRCTWAAASATSMTFARSRRGASRQS